MVKIIATLVILLFLVSCTGEKTGAADPALLITGTWKLFSATTIEKNDTSITNFGKDQEMIKIINATHFAFFRHDLNKGKDSANAIYSSGGGRYTLTGDQYTEQLDYCDAREWEGHEFNFTVTMKNDTLVQQGIEKIEKLGIDRVIIERYTRVKK